MRKTVRALELLRVIPVTAIVPSRDMSKQVMAPVCGFRDNGDDCLLIVCALPIFRKFQ